MQYELNKSQTHLQEKKNSQITFLSFQYSSASESANWSKNVSRYHEHFSIQSPRLVWARHFWSAIIWGERPHSSISVSVWWTARLYSPLKPSCITLNSQFPRLFRYSNCSAVHLNHFMRKTRIARPWDMMTRLSSSDVSCWSLFMSMSLHNDSRKPAYFIIKVLTMTIECGS